jgi:hypothetical protein
MLAVKLAASASPAISQHRARDRIALDVLDLVLGT